MKQLIIAALLGWLGMNAATAHPAFSTSAEITVNTDGSFRGQAEFDTLAFALNDTSSRIGNEPMEQLLAGSRDELASALGSAKSRFSHGFVVTTDAGPGAVDFLDFPEADQVIAWRDNKRPVLPVVLPVTISGHLPATARSIEVRFPAVLEQVILTLSRPNEEPVVEAVEAGSASSALPIQIEVSGTSKQLIRQKPTAKSNGSNVTNDPRKWLEGTHFPVLLGMLLLLSFGGAFAVAWWPGWKRRTR